MIPMDWIDLDSVKATSQRHPNSWGSTSPAPTPLTRGCLVRVDATALILGQLWKENFSINHPIFKKRGMRTQNNSDSFVPIKVWTKPKSTVKNYQRLGYIYYDATTSSSVTF